MAGAAALVTVAWRGTRRVVVEGDSMWPGLADGDRLLVVRGLAPRPGDIVALRDPQVAGRSWVKRVVSVSGDGVEVRGDNVSASTDSRQVGPVDRHGVIGRVVYRYHPPSRAGRLPGTPWLRSRDHGARPRRPRADSGR